MASWLSDVILGLENLEGVAPLEGIYAELQKIRPKPLPQNFRAIIRKTLETHSSDSEAYAGKKDVFYSASGLGAGIWGLRKEQITEGAQQNEITKYANRKNFIEAQGATCDNWTWSWSFVNHEEKAIIFGAWDIHESPNGQKILDEDWRITSKNKAAPGFSQSREHMRLVEEEGYKLSTFPIIYSDDHLDESGVGPAKMESFVPILTKKALERRGSAWFAVETEEKSRGTAQVALPLSGDKLYQKRAREALPILIRQAQANQTIRYSDLAQELRMPNARNLNFVLGSIGQTLINLKEYWELEEEIPPIQCLVVNQRDGLPGDGIDWFIEDAKKYRQMTKNQRKRLVDSKLAEIYDYRDWDNVLKVLGLTKFSNKKTIARAQGGSFRGGGEGPKHKALKDYVARNPTLIGLPASCANGEIEHSLLSGDSVDVRFFWKREEVLVEIKSSRSGRQDLCRGLFQCVKYKAVMEAEQRVRGYQENVRSILVIEEPLSSDLLGIKNTLGVEVIVVPLPH